MAAAGRTATAARVERAACMTAGERVFWEGRGKEVIWLAQSPTQELESAARAAAELLKLPLEITQVGETGLADQILKLVAG